MNLKNHPDTWRVLMPFLANKVTFPPELFWVARVLGLGFEGLP
jgi:hypothetical protein